MKLIEEMESHLPIPVYPTEDLGSYLSQNGKNITADTQLMITKVFDSGYEGGIVCLLEGIVPESFVISITLLRVKPDHPLFDKISAYQKRRIRSIFRSNGLKPGRR
ncbi:MAG: hypothetical protein PHS80_07370 [Methanothrix sp.]|nr:hypothetical protein [Methanothrix sp.]MDD4446501.1 hypothetical protein [Methanothrix sp.]